MQTGVFKKWHYNSNGMNGEELFLTPVLL